MATVTSCTVSKRGVTNAKKLVPPLLNRWALFAIPFNVMLIPAPGMPSNVLSRGVTPCWAPAERRVKGSVSLPARGKSCKYF